MSDSPKPIEDEEFGPTSEPIIATSGHSHPPLPLLSCDQLRRLLPQSPLQQPQIKIIPESTTQLDSMRSTFLALLKASTTTKNTHQQATTDTLKDFPPMEKILGE